MNCRKPEDDPPPNERMPTRKTSSDAAAGSRHALEALNFFVADVQNGMGPYVTLFLKASMHWNPAQIGIAMAAGNIAGILAQTPAGALIDHLRQKRPLLIAGAVLITLSCLAIVGYPYLPVVATAQALIGVAGAIFPPALAALALGLVGRQKMDRQLGKNQAFNAAGNVFAALLLGGVGYFLNRTYMFYVIPGLCAIAVFCLLRIKNDDIDYELSRGGDRENDRNNVSDAADVAADGDRQDTLKGAYQGLARLSRDARVRTFLICAVLFHFANAALVPLVTQLLSSGENAPYATLYTSGFMVGSQLIFVLVGALAGRLAGTWGRKPLFLIAFVALVLRAFLFTLGRHPFYLIAIQALDGFGAGIFGVVSVLIIADLTKGTGRFNIAQGGVATAVGVGAFLSNLLSGFLVKHAGYNVGFLTLAGIGAMGLLLFWRGMPETLTSSEGARRWQPDQQWKHGTV